MKNISIIITFLIFSFSVCHAQEVLISKKDGTMIESKVVATNATTVFIPNGNVLLKDISSVNILTNDKAGNDLANYFAKANITVTINGQTTEAIKQTILATQVVDPTLTTVSNSLEKFRAQRQTGKGLQMLGILVVSGSIALQAIYNQKYQDDLDDYIKGGAKGTLPKQQTVSPIVSIAGGGLAVIGFAIDLDAGKHLRLRK